MHEFHRTGIDVASLALRLAIASRRLALITRSVPLASASLPRMAWFRTKRTLGIGSRSDRGFLVEEFVRRVRSGDIGPACHVTAERSDGAGAQAQAKMAAFALARAYGLTYVHAPFSRVEHAEGPADEWTAAWENMFNLGHGEIRVTECPLPRIAIEEFMADKRWWQSPCLLSAGHFVRFADREPAAMSAAASQLRAKYYLGTARRPRSGVVEICAHLRRGDVAANDAETAGRFVSADALAASIARTRLVLTILGLPSQVRLFSQGRESDFSVFRDMGCELHVGASALTTFRELVAADVLVMSKSSFSYVAAILNEGTVIYDRYARAPLPTWVERNVNGGVNTKQLRERLIAQFLPEMRSARPRWEPSIALG